MSEPCEREVATKIANPALASQAENVKRIIGIIELEVEFNVIDQIAVAINRVSIIPSRHRRADKRCERLNARPIRPRMNAEVKLKYIGDIRCLWIFTIVC